MFNRLPHRIGVFQAIDCFRLDLVCLLSECFVDGFEDIASFIYVIICLLDVLQVLAAQLTQVLHLLVSELGKS